MRIESTDLAILAAYLLGMVAFGLWIGRRQSGAADFMVGGRRMPWWLVLFSIVATETSTVTFLSVPGIAYENDLTWLQLPFGFAIGRVVVTFLLLPRYFRGELFTAYQVLHDRFGGATRQVASLLFLVTRTLADGLRLFLSAIVLQAVADVEVEYAVIALGVATIVYTFVGGMRAVLWTDFVQFVVYMAGAGIAAKVLLDGIPGGLDGFLDSARAFRTEQGTVDKLTILDTSFDLGEATNLYAGLIGGAILAVATHGVDQLMVQRYLAARGRIQASVALVTSGLVVVAQFALFLLIGVGLAIFYAQPAHRRSFEDSDYVFATFIVQQLPSGVLGVVLGAVFSAAMSTLSSSLNSSATALSNDIWHPLFRPSAGDRERLVTIRLFVVLFGAMQIAVGIQGQYLDESIVGAVLSIASFTTGIVLGVFLLGIFVRRCGQTNALASLLFGSAVVAHVKFDLFAEIDEQLAMANLIDGFRGVAWPWFALIGSSATFLFGALASAMFPRATQSMTALSCTTPLLLAALVAGQQPTSPVPVDPVRTGLDMLVADAFAPLRGQRVGLVTNHTGLTADGRGVVDVFLAADGVDVTALFSPEHGFDGVLDRAVADSTHTSGLTIHSLYGQSRKPTPEALENVDTLVFDIQDIGCRFYTYIATMRLCMEAAAEHQLSFIVLDRPNPIGGLRVDGPVLAPGDESFIAAHTIPLRHGMTVGELARMMNVERSIGCDLQVIEMDGWQRAMTYDETGLTWIDPSPNMRTLNEALLYPGIGLVEFTNVSVGRGTDTPFEIVGAPWIDARRLAATLRARELPGVTFVPVRFVPESSKHAGAVCAGVQILVTDRDALDPIRTGLTLAWALRRLHPDDWQIDRFTRLLAEPAVFAAIRDGAFAEQAIAIWQDELDAFRQRRRTFLLYR